MEIIVGNWEKESKTKLFRNYSSRLTSVLSAIRTGRARAVEAMFMEETDQELDIAGNTGNMPK